MGMFPQKIERPGAQTYSGLTAETITVTGLNAEINDVPPSAATSSPHASGSFTAWDDAHHTLYAFMMAFVEGERYLVDAVLDQLSYLNMQLTFDGFVIYGHSPDCKGFVLSFGVQVCSHLFGLSLQA